MHGGKMSEHGVTQKVAAILAADAVGYTRLMADNESETIAALDEARAVFAEHTESNHGRVVDTAGDSILAIFDSTAGAVHAAVAIQTRLAEVGASVPEERRMRFRIGVHLGDIHQKADGTVYGDGVNVAARLQSIAEPGGIVTSDLVQAALRGRLDVSFSDAGTHAVKHVKDPVHAYRVAVVGDQGLAVRRWSLRRLAAAAGAATVIITGGVGAWLYVAERGPPMVTASGTPTKDLVLAMPTGPSVAVLPFANLSGDAKQDYLATGITEDIIAALSRFRDLRVLPSRSSAKYKGAASDLGRIGRELGAGYVMEGSVRRSAGTLRVAA
jgi:adenylate cyclase